MILRDPVHGLIEFEGQTERIVLALLQTKEVQRLRRVRQLGLASIVFPGAEHTRFAHALGAAHVMTRLLKRIRQCDAPDAAKLSEALEGEAMAATLLHDLGHGPFSHLFEEVLPHAKHHEAWTQEIILDESSEAHQQLETISKGMSGRVAALLRGEHGPTYLARSISGTLDVDRADYLLRDSHMTGVSYGLYDLDWVLRALTLSESANGWVLAVDGHKGLPAIESYFLGRHFMYQQVYHHKVTRAAEALVRGIFVRLAELIVEGNAPTPLPSAIAAAALGESISIAEYLSLDDAEFMSATAAWTQSEDTELAALCTALRERKLPKTIPLPENDEAQWHEAYKRAAEVAESEGFRSELHVWLDIAEDIPYAEPEDERAEGPWLKLGEGPLKRLGDASFVLRQLRNQVLRRPRLIVPEVIRERVTREI